MKEITEVGLANSLLRRLGIWAICPLFYPRRRCLNLIFVYSIGMHAISNPHSKLLSLQTSRGRERGCGLKYFQCGMQPSEVCSELHGPGIAPAQFHTLCCFDIGFGAVRYMSIAESKARTDPSPRATVQPNHMAT